MWREIHKQLANEQLLAPCRFILIVFVNKQTKKCSGSHTWQHKDCGWPACGARELLELSPGVDGIMDQRFAAHAGQVEGPAGDEQAQDILWLSSAALWIKLDGGPANTVRK